MKLISVYINTIQFGDIIINPLHNKVTIAIYYIWQKTAIWIDYRTVYHTEPEEMLKNWSVRL